MDKKFEGYLLVTDMDGTLLNDKGKISKVNREAIAYFINEGGRFTIATGRMTPSARNVVYPLNINFPAILYNGCKIYDYTQDKTLYQSFLEEDRKSIIEVLKKEETYLGIEIYCEDNVYIYKPCRYSYRFSRQGYDVIYQIKSELWDKKWTKVLLIGEEQEIDYLESIFYKRYDQGLIIRSGARYLEITPQYSTKGAALNYLMDLYHIDPSKVIAVGDNMNDIDLLENAAYGFCVANGAKRLVDKARYFAPSNNEDAIAYVIRWIEHIV
ncbi:Cof-type HAD-IIB family hydrolase [Cellulosilyticum sp. I15G10I2]|uniref:Cof-type HAD-IIB family hydrolase n=1 Tax=Cellulosilyticum sp. I15G10I2 TaxID=1892843 RepID=UPI00085C566F|nr:Cof-type HAD-IIB family hydrolase [Cellulosilyticum sp. I15G10I2]